MARLSLLFFFVLWTAAAFGTGLSFAQTASRASSSAQVETPPLDLRRQIRRGQRLCDALSAPNYTSPAQRIVAMRDAGGKWAELAEVAVALDYAEQERILEVGYRIKCDYPMSWDLIEDRAYRFWPIATALTMVFAAIAAAIAFFNLGFTRKSSRFSNAVGLYRRYLELCVRYPTFAEPEPADNITEANHEEYRKYQWFLGVLFRACEEVLEHGDDRQRWTRTVRDQLGYHVEFLRSNAWLRDHGMTLYSARLQRLIREVRRIAPQAASSA